jgi:hypothetical protein
MCHMDHCVRAVKVFMGAFEMGCKASLQNGVHVDEVFGLLGPKCKGGGSCCGFNGTVHSRSLEQAICPEKYQNNWNASDG